MSELLKARDVCAIFGVSNKTLMRWRKQNLIRSIPLGGQYRYSREEIERILREGIDGPRRSKSASKEGGES